MSIESELAKTFDEDVVDRYGRRFVQLLAGVCGEVSAPVKALDLLCGTGHGTLQLADVLPEGSTVVALSDDRFSLKRFHDKLSPQRRRSIFPRKENLQRLPFADNTLDLVWGCFATQVPQPLRPVLRQATRVLRPGGKLHFAAPLQGSLLELMDLVSEANRDRELSLPRLLGESGQLVSGEEWTQLLEAVGAKDVRLERSTFKLLIEPPPSKDRLIARHLTGLWLGQTGWKESDQWLDCAVTQPLETTVHVALISATKAQN